MRAAVFISYLNNLLLKSQQGQGRTIVRHFTKQYARAAIFISDFNFHYFSTMRAFAPTIPGKYN
jgi:hypothetical protein